MKLRSLVWFRGKDLRLADHRPLHRALAERGEVIPLFVLDPYFFSPAPARDLPHRMQFLLESLRELQGGIAKKGSRLMVVTGKSTEVVPRLARLWRVDQVLAQRWVEPFARERDRRVARALGVPLILLEGETLHIPGTLRSKAGRPYSMFGPFARAFLESVAVVEPLAAPRRLPPLPPDITPREDRIPTCKELGIEANPAIVEGGEGSAHRRLARFLRRAGESYADNRDRMDLPSTSRLSADLKFGTLSARQVWTRARRSLGASASWRKFSSELLWRELSHDLLWEHPGLLERPFKKELGGFPWRRDATGWRAWTEGRTGYPVVDAAARQLLGEGFVHNRARMISATFLIKDLLIDYRRGEAHYLKYLTDGDWAQNNLGWQWCAGCGADAQPWFRVFNPVAQGERFDPEGDYVRRWVPELARVPAPFIHRPWEAPNEVLLKAGVQLGVSYPGPIVDHAAARARYLAVTREHLTRGSRRR